MTKFIGIATSKGGAGKTTIALNLGLSLLNFGREVIVLDGNFSAPHIGMHLGSPINPHSLHDVLKGKKHITETVYSHASGLKIIPLHISADEIRTAQPSRLKQTLHGLKNRCEAVIIDSPSGLGKEAEDVISACHEIILVTTPDMPSVTEALKTKHLAARHKVKVVGVVVNKARLDSLELSVKNIEQMLGVPVLEIIPYDDKVRHALHMKHPVSYSHPESEASLQFKKLASKLIGEKYVQNLEKQEMDSDYERLLEELGLGSHGQ